MNFIISAIRTLFRHRWLILIGTFLVTILAYYYTRHMQGDFDVKATLYTGVASGYNLENDKNTDWAMVQNSMDNLISIMQAESTLKRVCIRLFARVLIEGNPDKDSNGITSSSYNWTYNHLKNSPHGPEILKLIDKSSEDKTVANLETYMRPKKDNYVYGLFYYNHPFYSYNALKNIKVQRRLTSDLLDVSYSSSDPGIAYNTVSILMDEFVNEYRRIRYGETDKVIKYFEGELERIGKQLRLEEDDLTKYNVQKRIINYLDETKEIAAISKEFELREQDALFAFNSTKSMLDELEKHMDSNAKQVLKNMEFVNKLKEASTITGRISEAEAMSDSNKDISILENDKLRLNEIKKELNNLTDAYIGHKYTKEGASRTNIIEQWLEQTLLYEKAKAELQIVQDARRELNNRYVFFAPVGTTIKQKERSINFTERNYLTVLQSYNEALLRKKNLEMTSATLKVLNEPTYPIASNATNRKEIVIASCVGSFLLIVALLLLIEMIDRTLRDSGRTKRVTGFNAIGAIPSISSARYGGLTKAYRQAATKELGNSLLRLLNKRKSPNIFIINLFSTCNNSGEQEIGNLVCEYYNKVCMLKTKFIVAGVDFNTMSAEYLLAKNITDFYTPQGEDILIVAYPPLSQSNIPGALLHDTNANILVMSAERGWKNIDTQMCEQLMLQLDKNIPFRVCLTNADREATEDFTGQLPPHTLLRKIGYHFSQLSLTEKIKFNFRKKSKEVEDEDDDE